MIKSVILQDFFSFKGENKIELKDGVNLLLGINGSGKTSFINSLRVLSEGIAGAGLSSLLQEQWGGFDQIVNCSGEKAPSSFQITYVFDYTKLNAINPDACFKSDVMYCIAVRRSGTSYTLDEKVYTNHNVKTGIPFYYLNFSNGSGKISMRDSENSKIVYKDYSSENFSGRELILRQINDPVHYLPIHTLHKAIESIIVYDNFDVSGSSRIRSTAEFSNDTRLRKSGVNLTQILNYLNLNQAFAYERLEEAFKNVNPNFRGIVIDNLYGQSYLSLKERNLNKAIGALHISDGTLRFLLMESIFYNPLRGASIAIDEPEKGMHPDMIRSIAEMMKYASKSSQIIVATHSPHLLNQFDLEDILVFEKDENNVTMVHGVSEDDFPEWEGEFLPGQMWLLGQIGGKRW